MKFNHLNVPTHWRNYWTRYPEGHTILEALISWVSQVDSMVDNQNKLNDNVEQFRIEIDAFVERFDERLQDEVTQTLKDWQNSGFLDVVISEALQWQLDDYIATNEQDKLSLTAQLQQIAVNVRDFSDLVVGDDWAIAIQTAINSVGYTGSVFFPKGTYRVTETLHMPAISKGIKLFSNGNATIKVVHSGDGIVLKGQNENSSWHILEGLTFEGPNTIYPNSLDYAPSSNGSGINLEDAYHCLVRDTIVSGFYKGVHLKNGIKNKFEGKTYIRFNQYGVYFGGGMANVNTFDSVSIRENRVSGIHFERGSAPYPSHNIFDSCLIESNHAYPMSGSSTQGVGVYIASGFSNIFNSCYFENHPTAILFDGQSNRNKFTDCRFNPKYSTNLYDKISFVSQNIYDTTFSGCQHVVNDGTVVVDSVGTNQRYNQFINCEGFIFSDSAYTQFDIINNRPNPAGDGDYFGALYMPSYSAYSNPTEGTTKGRIEGVGTIAATLHADGYGEVILLSGITADTTITNIKGLKRGQLFTLVNYQKNNVVTIKSSPDGTSGLVLKNRKDAILSRYSDSIVFWVTQNGKIVEVGRNLGYTMSGSRYVSVSPIDAGGSYSTTIPTSGVEFGDFVDVSTDKDLAGVSLSSYVSKLGEVRVVLTNNTTSSISLGTIRFMVKATRE